MTRKYNLHDKYVLALKAIGGAVHRGRTSKYTEMRVPAEMNAGRALTVFVGKSGAVRTGATVGKSFPLDPNLKAKLLACANKMIDAEAAGGTPVEVRAAELAAIRADKFAARAAELEAKEG